MRKLFQCSSGTEFQYLKLQWQFLMMGAVLFVFTPRLVQAGRPLNIDDAPPVAAGQLEIELGLLHSRPRGGGRESAFPVMTVAYGLIERLEVGLSLQRVDNRTRGEPHMAGFEDLHLTTKFNLLEETLRAPAVSLGVDVKLPTANRDKSLSTGQSDQAFTVIVSRSFAPLGLHLNLGYTRVDSPSNAKLKNFIHGGIAADYVMRPELALVGEIFGASRPEMNAPNEAAFQLGLRYALTPRLVLDAAAGRSLRATGSRFGGTAGLTWNFDPRDLLKLYKRLHSQSKATDA